MLWKATLLAGEYGTYCHSSLRRDQVRSCLVRLRVINTRDPSRSVAIVLEETPDLCNTSYNSRSFSAGNINVLKVQEWLSHAQSSNADLPNTWENHFSVELFS